LKREVVVSGGRARLQVEGGAFAYERAEGERIQGSFEIQATAPGAYLVRIGTRSYRVAPGTRGEACVNGRVLPIEVFDPRDLREAERAHAGRGRQRIAALMPGKVIRVLVAPGDRVEAGQGLVVVEAMKMQNEMKSPQAGRVAEVRAQAGATVGAGDVLIIVD
jgi:biotin carboxyl carrier protein